MYNLCTKGCSCTTSDIENACYVQIAMHRMQCTDCNVQNAMYRLRCTEEGVQTLTMCILNLVTLTYSFLVTRAMIPKTGEKKE